MKNSVLLVPGTRTPRLAIWCLGIIHGKVLKTASIDPDTGKITSGYITGKTMQVQKLCAKAAQLLENDLKTSRCEASQLILELTQLRALLDADIPAQYDFNASSDERRRADRTAVKRASLSKRESDILMRLAQIDHHVRSLELHTIEQLHAAVSQLQVCFATYAHGALLSPVSCRCLPDIQIDLSRYYLAHTKEEGIMTTILKEVA